MQPGASSGSHDQSLNVSVLQPLTASFDLAASPSAARSQLRSVMLAFKIVLISNTLLRFLGHRMVCWTYIMTAFGEVPMEIIGAGVAWHFCWLYAPKDAKRDPVVQVHALPPAASAKQSLLLLDLHLVRCPNPHWQ